MLPSKNVLIFLVVLACFVVYSLGLWGIAQDVNDNKYLRKENAALATAITTSNELGKKLATAEQKLKEKQQTITKEVIREVEKPVYRECRTTDDGVQLIERAIDSYPTP